MSGWRNISPTIRVGTLISGCFVTTNPSRTLNRGLCPPPVRRGQTKPLGSIFSANQHCLESRYLILGARIQTSTAMRTFFLRHLSSPCSKRSPSSGAISAASSVA